MNRSLRRWRSALAATAMVVLTTMVPAAANTAFESMADGENGWEVEPIFTVGESIGDYVPPGVLDGLGAYELDDSTVRVLANHEMLHFRGYEYEASDGAFTMTGARVSYFDIDKETREVVGGGLAHNNVYDANGDLATDIGFLANDLAGFSRFCSGVLVEAHDFASGNGLEDRIYFAGEEDGGFFNPVGGTEWALDPATGDIWALPDLGRGAWENIAVLDTGDPDTVAVILADDSSPFDFDGDGETEAAPLFLYVGEKDPDGDFPARNGLRGGSLYAWVANDGSTSPTDFNTSGKLRGTWVEVDNTPNLALGSEDGSTGYDEYGYPTQGNLWLQAIAEGAFGFSRPEDVATNPKRGSQFVLASTGVDTYEDGVDTFGTMYTMNVNFKSMKGTLRIIYDGDADPARSLRSPDNLEWADDGRIYIQEDKAEDETLDGEPLFGDGAANPLEAGIVRMNSNGKQLIRVAGVNRDVVVDPSADDPFGAIDRDAGVVGEWETSGIIDVSKLFGEPPGSLFLFDVQAHGIDDQATGDPANPGSRLEDDDLGEGGQLSFLIRP